MLCPPLMLCTVHGCAEHGTHQIEFAGRWPKRSTVCCDWLRAAAHCCRLPGFAGLSAALLGQMLQVVPLLHLKRTDTSCQWSAHAVQTQDIQWHDVDWRNIVVGHARRPGSLSPSSAVSCHALHSNSDQHSDKKEEHAASSTPCCSTSWRILKHPCCVLHVWPAHARPIHSLRQTRHNEVASLYNDNWVPRIGLPDALVKAWLRVKSRVSNVQPFCPDTVRSRQQSSWL